MKSGLCVKCGQANVYRSEVSRARSSDAVTLKEGFVGKDASSVTRYVCGNCGYLEYYLGQEQDLSVVREAWEKVSAPT